MHTGPPLPTAIAFLSSYSIGAVVMVCPSELPICRGIVIRCRSRVSPLRHTKPNENVRFVIMLQTSVRNYFWSIFLRESVFLFITYERKVYACVRFGYRFRLRQNILVRNNYNYDIKNLSHTHTLPPTFT